MKRILLLVFFVSIFSQLGVFAQGGDNLETAISLYKSGKYDSCITMMTNVVKEDPSDSLAYYYLGLSYARKNQRDLATKNYDKVIVLSTDKTLKSLAKQGKVSLGGASVTACDASLTSGVEEDAIIPSVKDHEKVQVESKSKSDMVVSKPIQPKYQQTNKSGQKPPTNDEIVQAIRVLQKAGLYSPMGAVPGGMNNNINPKIDSKLIQEQMLMQALNSNQNQQNNNPMAALMGMGNGNNNNNNNNMMNMLPYLNQKGGNPQVNQQFMQTMMMSQMMPNFDFSSNENKDY